MPGSRQPEVLNERAQHLLKVLVDSYIRNGQPVGSQTLSRDSGLDISPATIRNVMADLEELGFVVAPHTSAGRVPTIKGYRFFVDTLVNLRPPEGEELGLFHEALQDSDPKVVIAALNVIEAWHDQSLVPNINILRQHSSAQVRARATEVIDLLE